MNVNEMFPTKWLSAKDLIDSGHKSFIATIASVDMEEIEGDDGKERKPVVSFANAKKQLILNKTNANMIAELYGGDTDAWAGKRVELYHEKVPFGAKIVDAIRVRGQVPGESDIPTDPIPRQTEPIQSSATTPDEIPF